VLRGAHATWDEGVRERWIVNEAED
jgi:hypothetical protein